MGPDESAPLHELDEAEALLRRGDLDAALRVVQRLPPSRLAAGRENSEAVADRQRLRLRAALQYRLLEAQGLSVRAREEVRLALALGTLFGIGVPQLVERVWPVLAGESYRFAALETYAQRLRQPDVGPLDRWLRHIADGLAGPERERTRAELLVHHAYFAVLHSTELVDVEGRLLARPPRLAGVRVQMLRPSGCPVCVWPDVIYTVDNLPELPVLPAHPGCRCVYRPVALAE
jgi:hypothetical protein